MDSFNQYWISLSPLTQSVTFSVLKILGVLFLALLPMVAYSVLAERKISAFIQDRQGPNRVSLPLVGSIPILGPFLTKLGIWQPLADGVKSILKEDFTPSYVRKAYFWLAPAITLVPAFMTVGDDHLLRTQRGTERNHADRHERWNQRE